ncbi:threonine/serine dehydratase [Terriglobus sp. RCC_193]|uniref:threonine ammonia-lyase n=1 Tax=Terriglobus sp. RCC_193 TaxID=3239218 RepID=UPI003525C4E9
MRDNSPMPSEPLITLADIHAARERIAGTCVRTGLYRLDPKRMAAAGFDIPLHSEIWLKAENEQPIGSFKLRGAYNKVASLTDEERSRGVITYSSGNHAQGVAYAGRAMGAKAVIVMPESAPINKREATKALGGEVVLVGPASSERKQKAEELVAQYGYVMVPPYDDPYIIAGQATCGLEIAEQAADADLILSPVSGGGLLSGVASGIKLSGSSAKVWGCEPELAGDATESFYKKELIEWPGSETTRTIADGLRTQSLGERNFQHILKFVDGIVTVTEDEILEATRVLLLATDIVPEPSGAVTLAAALFHSDRLPEAKKIVVVVSGGNIDPALKEELLTVEA